MSRAFSMSSFSLIGEPAGGGFRRSLEGRTKPPAAGVRGRGACSAGGGGGAAFAAGALRSGGRRLGGGRGRRCLRGGGLALGVEHGAGRAQARRGCGSGRAGGTRGGGHG